MARALPPVLAQQPPPLARRDPETWNNRYGDLCHMAHVDYPYRVTSLGLQRGRKGYVA